MANGYAKYSGIGGGTGGGGGGVTSLNSLTGALNLVAGSGITVTPSGSNITIAATGAGSGTVTSVALSDGSTIPLYSISGSPVTAAGTLTFTLNTQAANIFLAGPTTGSAAQPTFRAIVNADLASITTLSSLSLPYSQITGAPAAITALTGDATASGPGSAALTLATVNSNVGSFTNANITVNAKGLITAASNGSAGTGTVTSVALAAPALFTVSGSPVTSAGTLTLSYSGTALPVANGGTSLTSLVANNVILGNGTSAPTFVAPGAAGNSLVSNGTTWISSVLTGSSSFAAYASSQVTTDSSAISSGTFTTFDNSPAFTFTPTITGTYKVYCSTPIATVGNSQFITRIINTSGSATLLNESQTNTSGTSIIDTGTAQSLYNLTAGTTYVFDIQGKTVSGTSGVLTGSNSPFYMFAEGIALAAPQQLGLIASAHVDSFTGGTPSGEWGSSTGSTMGPFNANTSAGPNVIDQSTTAFGVAQTANSNLPQITVNNLVPGIYKITTNFNTDFTAGGAVVVYALNDGTTTTGHSGNITGAGGEYNTTITGVFKYTGIANITFAIWASASVGQPQIHMQSASNPDLRLNWVIEKVA